eukprot:scaffold1504_cov417-Prasinococcus_capsulatus_cf.AAC.16
MLLQKVLELTHACNACITLERRHSLAAYGDGCAGLSYGVRPGRALTFHRRTLHSRAHRSHQLHRTPHAARDLASRSHTRENKVSRLTTRKGFGQHVAYFCTEEASELRLRPHATARPAKRLPRKLKTPSPALRSSRARDRGHREVLRLQDQAAGKARSAAHLHSGAATRQTHAPMDTGA